MVKVTAPPFVFSASPRPLGPSPIRKTIANPSPVPTTYHHPLRMTRPTVLRPNAHVPRQKRSVMDDGEGFDDVDVIYETEWGDSDNEKDSPGRDVSTNDDTAPSSAPSPALFDKKPPRGYKVLERVQNTPAKSSDTSDGFLRGETIPITPLRSSRKRKQPEPSPLLGVLEMVQDGLQTQAEKSRTRGVSVRGRFKELKPLMEGGAKKRRVAFTDGMDGFTKEEMGVRTPLKCALEKRTGSPDLSCQTSTKGGDAGPQPPETQHHKEQLKAVLEVEDGVTRKAYPTNENKDEWQALVEREVSCSPVIVETVVVAGDGEI